ncbi:hypothetical protein NLI96_g1207 [Meripilus lineatus]|uniref:Uncharacterized protein n=1 Tax=Meripilus lineatus TaxID=2056292 RepID=A0AAD5VD92_9APHY|nr:hypothetical protein NLI96_g1207 [Physisporinus lineatus]
MLDVCQNIRIESMPILTPRPRRVLLKPEIKPEDLPTLPDISDPEIKRQVFTHRSYHARPTHVFEDPLEDPSPDNEMCVPLYLVTYARIDKPLPENRLEHLGDSVLSLIVTGLLAEVYPTLRVGPATKIRALIVGNQTLATISVMYQLHDRLITHPAQAITLRASTNIQGGLYKDKGLAVVMDWLQALFRPFITEAYRHVRVQHELPPDPPAVSPTATPPLPAADTRIFPWSSPPPLALSQAAGEGSRTTPIWVVRAMVQGECLGRGRGSTKKAAKNEAAKEGLKNMSIDVP